MRVYAARSAAEPLLMPDPHDSVDHIYTPLQEAVAEVYRRKRDKRLNERVQRTFDTPNLHPPFVRTANRPIGLYCRNIISPNHEFNMLQQIFPAHVLESVLLEYNAKFVARNNDSYHLCRLRFEHQSQPSGECRRVVDFNAYEGQRFRTIKTVTGEQLHQVHRRLLAREYADIADRIQDITDWFDFVSTQHAHRYFYYLAVFVLHGILFENYLPNDKEERALVYERVLPAFDAVRTHFGVRPLIVRIMPKSSEHSRYWNMYPQHLLQEVGT